MLPENTAESNMPQVTRRPPTNVVKRNPIRSVRMPEIGDKKNVVPMVSEPTRAASNQENIQIKCRSNTILIQ